MKMKEYLILKQYILISTYRVKTLKAIGEEVKIPTKIARDAGLRTNHISKILNELKTCGVAICLNEDVRKGRLYQLTELGLMIYHDLMREENED